MLSDLPDTSSGYPQDFVEDEDALAEAAIALQAVELEEIRCDFLALSDRMVCSKLWPQGIDKTLESAMDIVLRRRKFLAKFEDAYRKEHDE